MSQLPSDYAAASYGLRTVKTAIDALEMESLDGRRSKLSTPENSLASVAMLTISDLPMFSQDLL